MKKANAIEALKKNPTQMRFKGFISDDEFVTFNLEQAKKPLRAYITTADEPGSCPLSIKKAEKVENDWQLTIAEEGYEEFTVVLSEEVVNVKFLKNGRFIKNYRRSPIYGDLYDEFESQKEAIKNFDSGQFNVTGYFNEDEIITSKVSTYEVDDEFVTVTTASGSKYCFRTEA